MNRNFDKIYEELVKGGIQEIKVLRKKTIISAGCFIILIVLVLFFYKSLLMNRNILFLAIILIISSLIYYAITQLKYKSVFKENIIKQMVYLYNNNFNFYANQGISNVEFRKSKFIMDYDTLHSEDLIQGYFSEGAFFKMSQIHIVKEEKYQDNEGHTQVDKVTLFKGLFGFANIGSMLNSKIDITTNSRINRFKKSRIEVDSAEFERKYDMFSTDKIGAMQIFTSEIIDEINNFKNNTGYELQIRVYDGILFFKIPCGECFEAPIIKQVMDFSFLHKYFKMIDTPLNIISQIIENANKINIEDNR